MVLALPGLYLGAASVLGLPHPELPAPAAVAVYGLAIVGAAFVLSWAGEAAQVDMSAGLALAILALLAVLPEYAVDFVFTMRAGEVFSAQGECVPDPGGTNPCSLALANMTGANRVLVGIGWPLVVLVAVLAARKQGRRADSGREGDRAGVRLPRTLSAEVVFLGIATLYSLTLPLRSTLTMADTVVLVAVFVGYALRLAQGPAEEPDLHGSAKWVAERPATGRRWLYGVLFAVAALIILATAEHFADGLVHTGSELGVDRFVLVQWVAPLASEAPELIVACLYARRLRAGDSLGTLLSSKVNQWTLLVGTLPLVFAIASGSLHGLPLDDQQRVELLLTGTQSFFAVSILVTLGLTWRGALALVVLFAVQFGTSISLPAQTVHTVSLALSGVYLLLGVAQLVRHRRALPRLVRDGLRTDPYRLAEEAA
ncbi:sodium:proton exchanger [Pseudonocardia kujensis]|uniref:sodium/calcium exchanger protein n=1 Tax=Pseudonocardia kujensis TaxID=1128675 RepID=UPI001E478EED|nr:sodium:proton exchanger [Pseudonocardia kujensis]MCE0766367.1 sodium:proton exchanger [Pseudonocardia kujensis]